MVEREIGVLSFNSDQVGFVHLVLIVLIKLTKPQTKIFIKRISLNPNPNPEQKIKYLQVFPKVYDKPFQNRTYNLQLEYE